MDEKDTVSISDLLNKNFRCLSKMANNKSCLIHLKPDKSCEDCNHTCGQTKLGRILKTIEVKALTKDPNAVVAYPRFEKNCHNQYEFLR